MSLVPVQKYGNVITSFLLTAAFGWERRGQCSRTLPIMFFFFGGKRLIEY